MFYESSKNSRTNHELAWQMALWVEAFGKGLIEPKTKDDTQKNIVSDTNSVQGLVGMEVMS